MTWSGLGLSNREEISGYCPENHKVVGKSSYHSERLDE
jgi:hypothetical protein